MHKAPTCVLPTLSAARSPYTRVTNYKASTLLSLRLEGLQLSLTTQPSPFRVNLMSSGVGDLQVIIRGATMLAHLMTSSRVFASQKCNSQRDWRGSWSRNAELVMGDGRCSSSSCSMSTNEVWSSSVASATSKDKSAGTFQSQAFRRFPQRKGSAIIVSDVSSVVTPTSSTKSQT